MFQIYTEQKLTKFLGLQVTLTCVLLNLTEIISYFLLFRHIYQHDNQVANMILTSDVIKLRNSKNTISLMGQLCTWLLETSYFLLLIAFAILGAAKNEYFREVASIFKLAEFTLVPFVQILCSPPLRQFTLQIKK